MSSALIAHEQPISRIFSNDYVFKIPDYQRPYAWTTNQAQDLIDDLTGFMKAAPGKVEDMPPYFLGSIVLIKSETAPNADVVDGQQRLTTLTILLSAIRAKGGAADITQLLYEKGSQILGTQDRFRLTLRDRDADFFQRYVQREGGFEQLLSLAEQPSDSRRNLQANAALFAQRLEAMSSEERLNLAQFIVTRCFLVAVATPDLDSAYRIFAVLNSRGLDLSPTDILKAEILGKIDTSQRESYTRKWEDMEDDLGRDSFENLFSHVRMVYRKAKPQGTLLKEFREHVVKDTAPKSIIDEILMPMAEVFEQLTGSSYSSTERAEAVNESLKWLNRLEFNDWLPPALVFAVRWSNNPEAMQAFFHDLERLAYCMLITKMGINTRIDRFSNLTKEIESGEDLSRMTSSLQLSPEEQFDTYQTLAGPFYDTLAARARSSVLLRLDSLLSGGGATYDSDTITVEHVLPQNPLSNSDWTKWFPEPQSRAAIVHTLGNLALLTRKKNSAARNFDFEKKKTAYFARGGVSPFVLTTQVLRNSEWTPQVVADRQVELMAKLEGHWRLQNRKQSAAAAVVAAMIAGQAS